MPLERTIFANTLILDDGAHGKEEIYMPRIHMYLLVQGGAQLHVLAAPYIKSFFNLTDCRVPLSMETYCVVDT